MKITPLAAESMGVRSMATFVETERVNILIDPGLQLVRERYNLPPHPLEHFQEDKLKDRIYLFAKSAHLIVITHFEEDHVFFGLPEWANGKVVLMKNPNQNISVESRRKAFQLLRHIQKIALDIIYIDSRTFETGSTRLSFSDPIAHGSSPVDGYVTAVTIREEDSFLFSSDIHISKVEKIIELLKKETPQTLYLSGPATYLKNKDVLYENLSPLFQKLEKAAKNSPLKRIILDHTLVRDEYWEKIFNSIRQSFQKIGIEVHTASTYRGEANNPMESRRKQLFKDQPPNQSK